MSERSVRLWKSWLWAFVPIYTLGFGSAAAMLHAAVKRKSFLQGAAMPVYLAGLAFVLVFDPDHGGQDEFIFGLGMTINMGIAFVHAVGIRSWVFPAPERADDLRVRQQRAMTDLEQEREARAHARAIVVQDPALARQLKIGRPDLGDRTFPDGGLVDVNTVDAVTLIKHTDLPQPLVDRIFDVRSKVGPFSSLDELMHLTTADPRAIDSVRELLVFSR